MCNGKHYVPEQWVASNTLRCDARCLECAMVNIVCLDNRLQAILRAEARAHNA